MKKKYIVGSVGFVLKTIEAETVKQAIDIYLQSLLPDELFISDEEGVRQWATVGPTVIGHAKIV